MRDMPSPDLVPRGPRRPVLGSLSDEDFEEICYLIVQLEHRNAFSTANPDKGADVLLRGAEGTYLRAWQAKRYTGQIRWGKCRDSLARARAEWDPDHYTFCFARDLTAGQLKKFDTEFRAEGGCHPRVDFWNHTELVRRLLGSDEGVRILRRFFEDPEDALEVAREMVAAGGELDTGTDVLDRLRPIGEFLRGRDPYFSYSTRTSEIGAPGPAPPAERLFSVERTQNGLTEAIDASPRMEQGIERYGPALRLAFGQGVGAQEAYRAVKEGLEKGQAVEVEGVEVTFSRLPAAFENLIGRALHDQVVTLKPHRLLPLPWAARVIVESDLGCEELDFDLQPLPEPVADWDDGLVGESAGVLMRMLFRWRESGGAINVHWSPARRGLAARDQLRTLRFLRALSGRGEARVEDREGDRDPLVYPTQPRELPKDTTALLAFLEDVVLVEDWTGGRFELPDEIQPVDLRDVAIVAHSLRNGGHEIRLEKLELTVDATGLAALKAGEPIVSDQGVSARLFGQTLEVGRSRYTLQNYKVTAVRPAGGQYDEVRVEPVDEEAGRLFQTVEHA